MKKTTALYLTAALLAGCGKNGANDAVQKPVPVVQTAPAQRRNLTKTILFAGSVEPVKTARMASPAEGPVTQCAVREGDRVEAGQRLVQVGRSQIATTALAAAREELRRQQAEFGRVEKLVQSGSLPGEQMDEARSNLKKAEAQVAAMETGANDYEIAAPWAGVVSKVWISEGNYVAPRAPLVELYDPASLLVRIPVPEEYALSIRSGTTVQVTLDAHPGKTFSATISRIYPELERTTRTATVEAVLNEPVELLSGMFARVELPVRRAENAIVFPEGALVVRPNGDMLVFVLDGETVREVNVAPLLEANGFVAVASGIEPDSPVVVRGNESLKDGAAVKAMPSKKKPVQ
jgi:membrane fusion protein (multidrug efflux system)